MKSISSASLTTFQNLLSFGAALVLLPAGAKAQVIPLSDDAFEKTESSLFEEIFGRGEVLFHLRARYEFADQSGLQASHAATVRARLGYTTYRELPLSATLEFSDVRAIDGNAYNQAGANNQPHKSVIADPESTELNQAFLYFKQENFSAKLGRQRLLIDNQRFIGNSGWRQTEQTFDALTLRYEMEEGPTFLYSYLDQINRIFGRENPGGRWDSDSHLVHIRSPLGPVGTGGTYAYFLKFKTAPASSGDTFGLWFQPDFSRFSIPVSLYLELAHQTENSRNPAGNDFNHLYYRAEIELNANRFTVGSGFERLEGNGVTAFQTPLAGFHNFNGWADQFLTTPKNGLDDVYLFATTKFPAKISGRTEAHHFSAQRGSETYGHELGVLLGRSLTEYASVSTKIARFDGKNGRPNVTKFWVQAELRF